MAGERLRPVGWTEISGVCTDSAHRGEGLATRLTRALIARIRRRGDSAFLLVDDDNANAIRLYEHRIRLGPPTVERAADCRRRAPGPVGYARGRGHGP